MSTPESFSNGRYINGLHADETRQDRGHDPRGSADLARSPEPAPIHSGAPRFYTAGEVASLIEAAVYGAVGGGSSGDQRGGNRVHGKGWLAWAGRALRALFAR